MNGLVLWRIAVTVPVAISLAGCPAKMEHGEPAAPRQISTPNLDALISKTSLSGEPIVLLVTESGLSPADDEVLALFDTLKENAGHPQPVLLDISVSRNRAEATRLHVPDTPVLFCLSSRGVIVSRDEKPLTRDLVLKRMDELASLAHDLDAQLEALEKSVVARPRDPTPHLVLADFLLAHHNAREAIPHLEAAVHTDSVDAAQRVRSWVALARAHLWIAEPEKARHEAHDLMQTLGATSPDAIAGGNLVLATHDTTGKRFTVAREELETAIAAAPDSDYGKEAREALAHLPPPSGHPKATK